MGAGETVLAGISSGGAPQQTVDGLSTDILIPTNAREGSTRMRVAMQRTGTPTSCGSLNQGEVEDYMLTIAAGTTTPDIPAEKLNQSIDFPSIPDQLTTTTSILLNATASSNLPITYKVIGGSASVNGNTLRLSGTAGTVVITAQQSGNDQYLPAQNMNRAFKVELPPVEEEPEEDNSDTTPAVYCDIQGNAPWQEWISKVSFGTINHTSNKDGYGDFTNQSTAVNKGDSYAISISPDFSWTQWDEYINVWIDFNQNGSSSRNGQHSTNC